MSRKYTTEEYKRKLEHQIYLAQEHPARIYDLTDCNLYQIPKGVFTFCKVLRKYSLNLSANHISSIESGGNVDDLSLLGELILSKNKFKHLSSSFTNLCNLQKLIVDDNKLVKFPTILLDLKHLKILNLEGNSIRVVPKEINGFKSLKSLNLSRNPISVLCAEITEIKTLEELCIDLSDIKNISQDVLSSGMKNIWMYLCKAKNVPFKEINFNGIYLQCDSHILINDNSSKEKRPCSYFSQPNQSNKANHDIDEEVLEHERKLSLLELEDKRKNIDIIKKKSDMEDEAIKAYLEKKKQEADRLFNRVKYEELSSKDLIESIFDYNNKSMKREELENRITGQTYFDRNRCAFDKKLSEDEKNDVLDSMNNTLKRVSELFRRHENVDGISANLGHYYLDEANSLNLGFIDQLKEIEKQKLAYKRLKLEKDHQMVRLQDSICLIEMKLRQLSAHEMTNPEMFDSEQNSRFHLTSLLTKLGDEKSQRERYINDQIEAMDILRDKNIHDFWIVQYQQLWDEKTKSENEIDELLKMANFSQWASVFKENEYTFDMILNVSALDLAKMGLGNEIERNRFLLFLREWRFNPIKASNESVASAPPEPYKSIDDKSSGLALPSAPPLQHSISNQSYSNEESAVVMARKETECCICLNLEARILLLNCGHVCCCKQCSLTVRQCPLCRQKIVQRVNLEFDV